VSSGIPGARSKELAQLLRRYESRNVTFLADDFPIFWDTANGATVTDADGNEYVDCTAAFGVANAGHCNPRVVKAVTRQATRLMHGMGDVHPTELRVRLFERLAGILPANLAKTVLATTGSEAIEAALKTAILATGKSRFAAYHGAYHGLSFGALAVGGMDRFRRPFAAALGAEPLLLDYPRDRTISVDAAAADARARLAGNSDVAALVVEPIQGRAGCVVPPHGYLAALRAICDELDILMIVDEIFTGFGRTGDWFAIGHERVVPDIICIGKAMASGLPLSAAVGRAGVMDAWPQSTGEALHTSTYLGNPLGCAAALATIDEIERNALVARAGSLGARLARRLEKLRSHAAVVDVRGRGLLWGVQLTNASEVAAVVTSSLARGVILLQSGTRGDTISISPPLVIGEERLMFAIDVMEAAIASTP
jgi:4-aminobutyrate aminotransferase-like enzyme